MKWRSRSRFISRKVTLPLIVPPAGKASVCPSIWWTARLGALIFATTVRMSSLMGVRTRLNQDSQQDVAALATTFRLDLSERPRTRPGVGWRKAEESEEEMSTFPARPGIKLVDATDEELQKTLR